MTPSMGDQAILYGFIDNSSHNNPMLNTQNQIIPEQFQLKHSNCVAQHTLIMLKLFLVCPTHSGLWIQTRLVKVTGPAVVVHYTLQLQAMQ